MSSNLPPGVSEGMLPGNRPEDLAWERAWEWADEMVINHSDLSVEEFRRAILIGIAAVVAEREEVKKLIESFVALEREERTLACDEEEEGDDPENPLAGVWHRMEGYVREDGTVHVSHSTNDNHDTGIPGPVERWEQKCENRAAFEKWCGRSRVGFMGCKVTVTLDGKEDY